MSLLDDHRRLSGVTAIAVVSLALLLSAAVLVTGGSANTVRSLAGGTAVALLDILLLRRGLSRLLRGTLGHRVITAGLFSRFAGIGVLLGAVLSMPHAVPAAAVAGFLLFPVALVVVSVPLRNREGGLAVSG
jgi:hypothetical protein